MGGEMTEAAPFDSVAIDIDMPPAPLADVIIALAVGFDDNDAGDQRTCPELQVRSFQIVYVQLFHAQQFRQG